MICVGTEEIAMEDLLKGDKVDMFDYFCNTLSFRPSPNKFESSISCSECIQHKIKVHLKIELTVFKKTKILGLAGLC